MSTYFISEGIVKGGKYVACPYYREPLTGESIGCCNDNLAEIPSETHQSCLCRSHSGIYVDFCPIYAKFQQKNSYAHKWSIFRRIFPIRHKKPVYSHELGQQTDHQVEPEKVVTQEETAAIEA